MNGILKFCRDFTVAVDEVDFREKLKPSAVLQYFQDVATAHAKLMDIGYEEMKAQNLCWVLTRLSYRIERYPALDEVLTVTTFPKKPRSVEATRDFYVTDKNGECLISGVSKWCVIDFKHRTIKRCTPLFKFADSNYRTDSPFEDSCPKLEPFAVDDGTGKNIKTFVHSAQITDLDRNLHVNNARYGDYILNTCEVSELEKRVVNAFDINFIGELKANDKFELHRFDENNSTFFEAINENGKTIFRAKIEWQNLSTN